MDKEDVDGANVALRALAHVDAARLESAIARLAGYGGRSDGGVSRQSLTEVENEARRYLVAEARQLGCEVEIDECANLFFRREGIESLAPVVTGSHVDTQPIGGKLDGAYGIVAGLEVIAALNDANIRTRRPVEVVVWTNEEGSRFAPGAMGSSAFVNPALLREYHGRIDADGVTFRDALEKSIHNMPDVRRRDLRTEVSTFVEAHIEQGPVLEQAGISLGVVNGIQGVRWFSIDCMGTAAHAGTTPMHLRDDAMATAMDLVRRLALLQQDRFPTVRATYGRWTVEPNAINTIPARAVFSVDVRAEDEGILDGFELALRAIVEGHPSSSRVTIERLFARAPTRFPEPLQALVEAGCTAAAPGRPLRMISGAFHDSMYLAEHCPTCMIFVSSHGGISHNAAEYSSPSDLAAGARALAYVVTTLATS